MGNWCLRIHMPLAAQEIAFKVAAGDTLSVMVDTLTAAGQAHQGHDFSPPHDPGHVVKNNLLANPAKRKQRSTGDHSVVSSGWGPDGW